MYSQQNNNTWFEIWGKHGESMSTNKECLEQYHMVYILQFLQYKKRETWRQYSLPKYFYFYYFDTIKKALFWQRFGRFQPGNAIGVGQSVTLHAGGRHVTY